MAIDTEVKLLARRRTKIVATLGPTTDGPGTIARLIRAGVGASTPTPLILLVDLVVDGFQRLDVFRDGVDVGGLEVGESVVDDVCHGPAGVVAVRQQPLG